MNIHDRQIELLKRVNSARTEREHNDARDHLHAWRQGVGDALEWSDSRRGRFLMEADEHYLNQGVERDMCAGVWLDWEAAE